MSQRLEQSHLDNVLPAFVRRCGCEQGGQALQRRTWLLLAEQDPDEGHLFSLVSIQAARPYLSFMLLKCPCPAQRAVALSSREPEPHLVDNKEVAVGIRP